MLNTENYSIKALNYAPYSVFSRDADVWAISFNCLINKVEAS